MLDLATVGIAFKTDGLEKGTAALKNTEQAANKMADAADKTSKSVSGMGSAAQAGALAVKAMASAFVVFKAVQLAKDATLLNARFEELGIVMAVVGGNAGFSATQMEGFALATQKMGISMLESRNTVIQLAQAQIDLNLSSKLARVAQDVAVIGFTNSSEALQRMIRGIKTGETETLKTLGINVSFEQSYKTLAASLGISTTALSLTQKTMARVNAVMTEGEKLAGTYEASMTSAGKQLRSTVRLIENFKVITGEVFNETLGVAVIAFSENLKDVNGEVTALAQNGKLKEWGADVVDTFAFVADAGLSVVSVFQIVRTTLGFLGARLAVNSNISGKTIEQIEAANAAVNESFAKDFNSALSLSSSLRDAVAKRRQLFKDDAEQQVNSQDALSRKLLDINKARAGKEAAATGASDLRAQKAKESAKVFEQAAKQSRDFIESLKQETQEVGLSADQIKMLGAARAAAKAPTAALREEIMAGALANSLATKADKEAKEAIDAARKSSQELADLRSQESKGIEDFLRAEEQGRIAAVKSANDAVKAAQNEFDNFGKLKSQISEVTLLRLQDSLAGVRAGSDIAESLEAQIDAQKRLIGVQQKVEKRDASKAFADELHGDLKGALSAAFRDTKNPIKAFGDALANTVFTRVSSSLADALVKGALSSSFGSGLLGILGFGGAAAGGGSAAADLVAGIAPLASGGAFDNAGAKFFASGGEFHNSVLTQATPFKFASGGSFSQGVAGEAGPEAVMPLTRAPDGRLGVQASGQAKTVQNVTINYNMTVGDVASTAQVRQAVAGSERRIAAGIGRSLSYGGALS